MKPIAIVGMAGIFPGAPDVQQYWRNIVGAVDAISDVPAQRWDKSFYDPTSTAVDRFYCKRGGFVDDYVDFDPLQFGVMPKAAQSADPDQLLSLRIGVEAIADAGYQTREFARERTGVIIGRGNYLSAGTLRLEQHVRYVQQTLQTLRDLLPDISVEQIEQVKTQLQSQLDYYGPDVAVGMIPNLVASRLANRLDLHGPAYTVDAACASSLLAVEQSCQLLARGDCDMMLAGGLHFTHDLTFWATFCQLGALSRAQKIKPFSHDADGILAGEGIGIVVLKRLADAERDNDRIYAVIQGVGSASDGRGTSLLAPSVTGQLLALQRAWQNADMNPAQIGLIEAHGTGTPAGDQAELETLLQFFGETKNDDAENSETINNKKRPVLGSVKSMIGHAMPAAGVAGLIKAALSIYHGVLPPTLHCEEPHPLLARTRFRAIGKAEPWPEHKRIAAVNAFGFGGINAHVVLSSHRTQQAAAALNSSQDFAVLPQNFVVLPKVALIAAATQTELLEKLRREQWDRYACEGAWRIAIIEPDSKRIELAKKIVANGKPWHGRSQIYFSCEPLLKEGKIAFLFPGVDSAFEPRAQDVAAYFQLPLPPHCESLDPAQSLLKVVQGLSGFNQFTFAVLKRLGVRADGMAGHSIGEWSAMTAAGMIAREHADASMAKLDFNTVSFPDLIFLAAACDQQVVQRAIEGLPEIALSHDNCPHQTIVCGKSASIAIAETRLREQSVMMQRLPIVSGFHSPFFTEHLAHYRDFFLATPLAEPTVPVWSATTAQPFPAVMEQKQQLALDHLVQPVRFRQLIENMYAAGYRVFIQLGTGSVSGFVQDTLKGKTHLSINVNSEKHSGLEQLCHLSAALWVEGLQFDYRLLGLADAGPAVSKSNLKLRLGVPLIRLQQPLALSVARAPLIEFDANNADPIQRLFHETLTEIKQVSDEVSQLWLRRSSMQPAGPRVEMQEKVAIAPFEKRIVQRLDINDNIPYVIDHTFYPQQQGWPDIADRHPVIPLTMEVTLLRRAIEQQLPGYVVIRFEEVNAFNWLVVAQPVDIEIVLEMKEFPLLEVGIEGYMHAKAIVAREYPAAPPVQMHQLINSRAAQIDAVALYRDNWMLHGPAYQSVIELGPIGDNGIRGRLRVSEGAGALLDNMGQLAGYWVMEQEENSLAMPIGVEQICFYGAEPECGEEFDCAITIRSLDTLSCLTDQQLITDDGRIAIVMNGWHTRRYQMDRAFWMASKQLQKYIVSDKLGDDAVLFRDIYDTAILRDYIARRYLNQIEMAQYEALPPRRRRSWLNGRVAVKDAVRAYCWTRNGHYDFYPKEMRVDNDANGQPLITTHITQPFSENLHISIAHKDLLAVAIVGEAPVGIDIEAIVTRESSFVDLAFSAGEQQLLPEKNRSEWIARCWAAKEAFAKRRGTGLQGKPKQFEIEAIVDQRVCVNGAWVDTLCNQGYAIGWIK
ncbi:MAG TPA: beta-ketoacyl synthase N-terminal-like domain-containing protein [Spongiibacteraceae bacterium]